MAQAHRSYFLQQLEASGGCSGGRALLLPVEREEADRRGRTGAAGRSHRWAQLKGIFRGYSVAGIAVSNVGKMGDVECSRCGAERWPGETEGLCCGKGRVVLPALEKPPLLLDQLINRQHALSAHFLERARLYNGAHNLCSRPSSGHWEILPVGVSPVILGFSPVFLGFSPESMGFSPRTMGFSPRILGFSPNFLGFSPKIMVFSPGGLGFSPKLCGVVLKGVSDVPSSFDCI